MNRKDQDSSTKFTIFRQAVSICQTKQTEYLF